MLLFVSLHSGYGKPQRHHPSGAYGHGAQKNNDTIHDFTTDSIETYVDGDWVKAKGTTLGADNGLGVAAIMAVLEDNNLKHGPLEA